MEGLRQVRVWEVPSLYWVIFDLHRQHATMYGQRAVNGGHSDSVCVSFRKDPLSCSLWSFVPEMVM